MRILEARLEGDTLTLRLERDGETMRAVRRFVYDFKPGEWEISKKKKTRSLDANAYCWKLINDLATALSIPPVEVYRNAIKNIGGVSDVVCVQETAVAALCNAWEIRGLGWQTEVDDSKLPGCKTVRLWYGSSSYTVDQMSRLIDGLVQDCKSMGIETKDEAYINSLLEGWK